MGLMLICAIFKTINTPSDAYLRERVVKLQSKRGSCSGEQVRAPSGQDYIVSAAHCIILKDSDNNIQVVKEDGTILMRKVLAEDSDSDLLLIEGLPGLRGLNIAESAAPGQYVKTFTHGFFISLHV